MRKLATPLSAALAISFVAIFLAAFGVLQMGAVHPVRGADQVPDPVSAYQDVLTKGRNLVPPITEPKPVLTSAPTPTTELTNVPHITLSAAANPRPALISTEAILTVRSRTAPPGANVAVPIWLENAGDMVRLEFNLNYDPLIAEVVDVRHGSRTSNTAFSYNAEIPGVIRFGTAAARGVSGDGSAAVVKFKIIGPRGSSSSMTLTNSVVGDDKGRAKIIHLVPGYLSVDNPVTGDGNGDGDITAVDALIALRMSVGASDEDLVMDVNKDGRVTPGDARQLLAIAGKGR